MEQMSNEPGDIAVQAEQDIVTIEVVRGGCWLPADDLQRGLSIHAMDERAIHLDVGDVEHLDAAPFQVMLAFIAQRLDQGRRVRLLNISTALERWFQYAGTPSSFAWGTIMTNRGSR